MCGCCANCSERHGLMARRSRHRLFGDSVVSPVKRRRLLRLVACSGGPFCCVCSEFVFSAVMGGREIRSRIGCPRGDVAFGFSDISVSRSLFVESERELWRRVRVHMATQYSTTGPSFLNILFIVFFFWKANERQFKYILFHDSIYHMGKKIPICPKK